MMPPKGSPETGWWDWAEKGLSRVPKVHEVKGREVSPRRGSTRYQSISNSPNLTNSGDP